MNKNLDGMKSLLGYLLRFLVLSLPIFFLINMNFYWLQSIYARINYWLVEVIGFNAKLFDSFSASGMSPAIYYDSKVVRIDSACTGIRSASFLFAMIFAFKGDLKKKIKYFLAGILAIIIVNISRILVSSVLFFNGIAGFDNVVWAASLNITAFIVFYFYAKKN